MLEGRPYSLKIKDVISHIALANSEYRHPFYEERTPKKACFIALNRCNHLYSKARDEQKRTSCFYRR